MLVCLGAWALYAACAVQAAPVDFPRGTVDWNFSTGQPGAPAGIAFSGVFHAAGDPKGDPPYLRRMVQNPPAGMRIDTTVPDQCTASDAELAVRGPDACPGSRLGGGTVEGVIYEPFRHDFVFDHFQHPLDVLNGANEQILLVHSEGYTVVRGQVRPDGSLDFDIPSCFPKPPAGGCLDDYVLELKSSTVLPPFTRGGRSYMTTPPACPPTGAWASTVRLWWSDGSADSVATRQPCVRAQTARAAAKRRRSHVRSSAKPHSRRRPAARRRSSSTR
jgi:hypothetical protein